MGPHKRVLDVGLGRFRADTRGAGVFEYILLVGLIGIAALVGYQKYGKSIDDKITAQAKCVETLSCGGQGGPGETGRGDRRGSDEARAAEAREIAARLVRPGGTGTAEDAAIVAADLAQLPVEVLRYMEAKGVTVVAARGSVTDYIAELRGVTPRGWPPGTSWDTVPGLARGTEVVIAVRNGRVPPTGDGHGAYSLLIHETFHGIDHGGGELSHGQAFRDARQADYANLSDYEKQAGDAGLQETFAETAARYFGGDPTLQTELPNIYAFWESQRGTMFEP